MKVLAIVAALAGAAHADRWSQLDERWRGLVWLHYELTAVQDARDGAAPHDLILAGTRLHGMVGRDGPVAYHVGLDLAAGSTLRGAGLAYDVALLPVGVGLRLGKTSLLAVGGGIGAMGAVGTLDDAMMLPVEADLELGGSWRLLARGRAAWVVGADGRRGGAAFADELEAMVGLRLGHRYHVFGLASGNGYFVGGAYRELLGARFVGIAIGYSIDLASR